jgi:hypothetical protein
MLLIVYIYSMSILNFRSNSRNSHFKLACRIPFGGMVRKRV